MQRLLLLFIIPAIWASYSIDMLQGDRLDTQTLEYHGKEFLTDDASLSRNDIKKIHFSLEKTTDTKGIDKSIFADIETINSSIQKLEKKYPNSRGYIIRDHGYYKWREDGSQYYRYHFIGKILKEDRLRWGARSLWVDEGRSKVRFIGARTISPSGDISYFEPSNAELMKASGSMVDFDNDVYLTANFPDVKIGTIVEYIYEDDEYNPFDVNMFMPQWYFQDDVPVYSSKITIEIPSDKNLNFITSNFPSKSQSKPEIIEDNSVLTYTWHLSMLPPLIEETQAPDYADITPALHCSSFDNYDYIYNWLGNLMEKRMEITDDIQNKVTELTSGLETETEKLAAIYYYVQREIEYISIKGSVSSGQTGHHAQFTFENKYGDCTDKSILLSTMYRALGFNARPIIIMTNDEGTIDRSLPDYGGNHAITLLEYNYEKIFLDATFTSMRFPYCGEWDMGVSYLDPTSANIGTTSVINPLENSFCQNYNIKLNIDGSIDVHRWHKLNGPYECTYRDWWEYSPVQLWEQMSSDWMQSSIPNAKLDSFNIEGVGDLNVSLKEEFWLNAYEYGKAVEDLMIFDIPGLENAYSFDEIATKERNFDIQYEAPYSESHNVNISLTEGLSVNSIPEKISVDNEYISYKAEYKLSKEQDEIVFSDNFIFKQRIIPSEDFDDFKSALLEIQRFVQNKVILDIDQSMIEEEEEY